MYTRLIGGRQLSEATCFLWGPRQTGKSTLLKRLFPDCPRYDLLLSTDYERLLRHPALIREAIQARPAGAGHFPVIIDEIQKVPALLDEVHWMIENLGARFILCGSSARKLKRGHANLLGGRAIRYELYPLTSVEIPGFSLGRALNAGLLPRHYDSQQPGRMIQAYVGDYLKEEIMAEALTRNIPAFSRFLEVAALSNGELINYRDIASECGVSGPTVKEYYQILVDTLVGRYLPAFRRKIKRRVVEAPKFFFFDLAPVIHLTRRGPVEEGSPLFGRAFEHFIWMELVAHAGYSGLGYPIGYWRTASGFEVDFVLGDGEVALEVKSSSLVTDRHLKGVRAFMEEHQPRRRMVVSLDPVLRRTADGIEILPWRDFLGQLWSGRLMGGPDFVMREA
jgi:predicted AAA+ superfamily ATPase